MRWRASVAPDPPGVEPSSTASRAAFAVLGLAAIAAAGWSLLALGAVPGARALTAVGGATQPIIDATQLPPLLTVADDRLGELVYDIACTLPGTETGSECDIAGTVFARAGQAGPFQPIALAADPQSGGGRYLARLPLHITQAKTGFSYYAVIRDTRSAATVTLPSGGAAAPQRSLLLAKPITADLGTHRFGASRGASARVAVASWGDGPGEVGIEEGPQLAPIGASSFAVDPSGAVTVLDEAHKRLLRFAGGAPTTPLPLPVEVRGTIADLAVRADGGAYVLESVGDLGTPPFVESFDAAGRRLGAWHTAEPTVSTLRLGAGGPQALQYPSGQWIPVADASGATPAAQAAEGRPGRAISGGRELVAQREGSEARVALVGPAGVETSWRVHSATPLAEIQLAEPLGARVLVVLRTYMDTKSEYVVLLLGSHGVERHFSIEPSEWAETSPLSRFRLTGTALYHLGSTPAGMFVDRYNLEVQ